MRETKLPVSNTTHAKVKKFAKRNKLSFKTLSNKLVRAGWEALGLTNDL